MSAKTLIFALSSIAAGLIAAAAISRGGTPLPTLTCAGETATIIGTAGPNEIVGTSGDDVIVGLGGGDRLDGAGGRDIVCGGGGNDTLAGGAGSDSLYGGHGDDRLSGGPGGYVYWTGALTDWEGLYGGPGHDQLDVRDLAWGPPAGDRCFSDELVVACPRARPAGVLD
ncbi:MAG: hypothetical protein MSC30_00130 [Gaiellaceae bacterium MAG52_C11]|nr:hypothetical protein [Candidatus Gaiellasilicea maunaloa]